MPFTNGYSTGSPIVFAKARNRVGVEGLVPEEDDAVVEPGPPDLGDGVVGEVGGEVDAGDLGAQGARDRRHLDGAVRVAHRSGLALRAGPLGPRSPACGPVSRQGLAHAPGLHHRPPRLPM